MDKKLMQAECDPQCGFMVRDHDENELVDMIKMHGKNTHDMDVTDEDARSKVKEV